MSKYLRGQVKLQDLVQFSHFDILQETLLFFIKIL